MRTLKTLLLSLLLSSSLAAQTHLRSEQIDTPRVQVTGEWRRGTSVKGSQLIALNINRELLMRMGCIAYTYTPPQQSGCDLLVGRFFLNLYVKDYPWGMSAKRCQNGQLWNGSGCRKDFGTLLPIRQTQPKPYNQDITNPTVWYQ